MLIAFKRLQYVVLLADALFVGQHGSFNSCGLNHAKDLSSDRFIHDNATEGNATRFAIIKKSADAAIPQNIVPVTGISYAKLTSTTPASQQTSQ